MTDKPKPPTTPMAPCGCHWFECDSCGEFVPSGEIQNVFAYATETYACCKCLRANKDDVHPTCSICGTCSACECEG